MVEHNKVVYAFLREDGTPFYIGMGSIDRARNHKKGSRNYRWWEEMKANPNYKFIIVDRSLTKQMAWDIELDLIKEFGRMDIDGYGSLLTNIHPGGSFWGDAVKKSVVQFNEDGYRLTTFNSISDAVKSLGLSYTTGKVSDCCNNLAKSFKGYRWFYESEIGDVDYIGAVERLRGQEGGHCTKKKFAFDVLTLTPHESKRIMANSIYGEDAYPGIQNRKTFKDRFLEISKDEYKFFKQLEL